MKPQTPWESKELDDGKGYTTRMFCPEALACRQPNRKEHPRVKLFNDDTLEV